MTRRGIELNTTKLECYTAGLVCPEPSMGEGVRVDLREGAGLWLFKAMSAPTSMEVNAFNHGKLAWGVYTSPAFIWELPMVAWQESRRGGWLPQELAFSVDQAIKNDPQAVADWFAGEANAFVMLLIDSDTNIIRAMRCVALPTAVVEALITAWKTQVNICSADEYNKAYNNLAQRFTTNELWARTKIYYQERP